MKDKFIPEYPKSRKIEQKESKSFVPAEKKTGNVAKGLIVIAGKPNRIYYCEWIGTVCGGLLTFLFSSPF